jgi:hypothetical protein
VRYRRNPEVLAQPVDGQAMLLSPDQTELLTLNPSGAAIWDALSSPGDIDEIVARVAAAWPDADPAVVAVDVPVFVDDLRSRGILFVD